jgi:curli biogenesis system outer membrane secretion channel CsgG
MVTNTSLALRLPALAAAAALVSSAALAQGITGNKQGQGGSVVQGSAGTSGSKGDSGLEHCDKPMGAVAVVEPQSEVIGYLSRYNLQSPVGLIRMMIQQSNCFIVVERGQGMRNAMQERALANAGELRQDSNVGGGQMVTADYILTPNVVFSENNAGGVGGGVGGLLGRRAGIIGGIAGGLKFKEAQTSMLLADARTTVQVAAAEGSTKKADLRLGAGLFGGGIGAAGGGYGNTNEGKIIAAAFLDNYNGIVGAVRNDPNLQRNVGTLAQEAAGGRKKAGAVFNEGDVLMPKIANVKLMSDASDTSKPLGTLARTDELVVIGDEKDGFINVQGANGAGWVKIVLVSKR